MIWRYLFPTVLDSLRHFPVVLLTGARQVGKSTLASMISGKEWKARYFTLDDRAVLDAALLDPDGFLGQAGLSHCREILGKRWRLGVLLYTGTESLALDDKTIALPMPAFLG